MSNHTRRIYPIFFHLELKLTALIGWNQTSSRRLFNVGVWLLFDSRTELKHLTSSCAAWLNFAMKNCHKFGVGCQWPRPRKVSRTWTLFSFTYFASLKVSIAFKKVWKVAASASANETKEKRRRQNKTNPKVEAKTKRKTQKKKRKKKTKKKEIKK